MGWTKFYTQNRSLSEPDSWSRTPLENMTGVELVHNDKKIAIYGQGTYWQSDTYESDVVPFGAPPQRLIARRIEKFIGTLCYAAINHDEHGLIFDFNNKMNPSQDELALNVNIWSPWVAYDKHHACLEPLWLILELNTLTNKTNFYTSKERI